MTRLVERDGAVNAHTHLYSGLVPLGAPAPSPPPASFLEILRRVWWRLDRALDEDTLRAAARFHVAHALLSGTTTLVDHHESPSFIEGSLDVLAGVCDELGARALLCYGATERNAGRDEARRGLAECRRLIEARPSGTVRGAIGLHAGFTVSDETLREAGDLARSLGAVVHVHLAEDACDVEDARRRGHRAPLARLLACGALPRGSILAHGVHLTEGDVYTCDARGLWLVHNPRSNANNRVGYARCLAASSRVALGTDGFPSDMDAEAESLRAEAAKHGDLAADPWLRREAGRALAAELFGPDAIRSDRVRLAEADHPQRVIEVDVGGRPVVRGGALVSASLDHIEADARRAAKRLWARMEDLP